MSRIKKFTGTTLLKIFGWKMANPPPDIPKYVCIIAPHTSFADVFVGKWFNWATGMEPKIMIKKEFFFFPISIIIRRWGAIPVDRNKVGGVVNQMADHFAKNEEMILAITPEGTRKLIHKWKSGFYRIAQTANVPLYLCVIDFKTKEVGFLDEFKITGDFKKDMPDIQLRYKGASAKNIELFSVGKGIPVFD